MSQTVKIGNVLVGSSQPAFVIGEIGINHNGNIENALKLIDVAALAGCDAVKFQKRTPEICVPDEQKNILRETPWGTMTYFDYKKKIEFKDDDYQIINEHCKSKNILWFASCWDEPSVDFIERFDPPCYKIASASLTDDRLLKYHRSKKRPIILSTGMSTTDQINHAISILADCPLLIAHSTSTYPCPPEELNLRVINNLQEQYPQYPVGYSGHEVGLQATLAAVSIGAKFVERHITLDRAMWGTDHAASLEPTGLMKLVRDIRIIEKALGDGVKRVYDSELPIMKKLRRV